MRINIATRYAYDTKKKKEFQTNPGKQRQKHAPRSMSEWHEWQFGEKGPKAQAATTHNIQTHMTRKCIEKS